MLQKAETTFNLCFLWRKAGPAEFKLHFMDNL